MSIPFEQFIIDYGINLAKCKLCFSEKQYYKGTNVHIHYIDLDKSVDGQDFLVLSRTLAMKYLEKNDIHVLKDADATKTEEGWGLIYHQPINQYDVDLSTIFNQSTESNSVIMVDKEDEIRNGKDLNKLRKVLYNLQEKIDANNRFYSLGHKYDCVIINTEKYVADFCNIDEDENGHEYRTSFMSGESFSTSILDEIEYFIENFGKIMDLRNRAESLFQDISSYAEKAIERYNMPDIIIDFSKNVITFDENSNYDTEEKHIYKISPQEYGDFFCNEDDDGGLSYYKEVAYKKIRKISIGIIEDQYDIDLFEVEN